MSRARDLADLGGSADAGGLSGRNLIINGAMQVWQRTTSVTTSSSGTFSADRWASNAGASTVFSRSTDVPTGFQYSLSVAGATYTGIRTRIEAANCKHIAGQKVTFSWYAKRTSGTGDMKTYLGYASAEDNFGTVTLIEEVVNTASASVSSDWARYTYTVTLPANVANGLHFVVFNGSASGAVTTLYTGVQLEVGETATPFEHEDFGTTLIKCKRYYEHSYAYGTSAGTATTVGMSGGGITGVANNGHSVRHRLRFDAVKCKVPNMTAYDSAGNAGKCNMPDTSTNVGQNFFDITTISFTAENNGVNTTDARHYLHYVANAEL